MAHLGKLLPTLLQPFRTCVSPRFVACRPHLASLFTSPSSFTYVADDNPRQLYPEPKRWPRKNEYMHPPQEIGEPKRAATYCHYRSNIKYSAKKMWYIATFIRGMSVDEAIKQLSFIPKKGAQIVKEILLEARDIAIKEHNFEYRSNMWIGESYATKGLIIKGIRRHARFRMGIIHYYHCHYFVRLVEGDPPKEGYYPKPTGNQYLEGFVHNLRDRKLTLVK